MSKKQTYVVRTSQIAPETAFHFSHPLNPNSDMRLVPLSDQTGMQRMGVTLGRIPPGKEGFLPHSQVSQEEFIFILEGEGHLTIDGDVTVVGPGDFAGFPTDGAVHHLENKGSADLVYLMGGERTAAEVARFPTLGKTGFWADGAMHFVDDADVTAVRPEGFAARKGDGQP